MSGSESIHPGNPNRKISWWKTVPGLLLSLALLVWILRGSDPSKVWGVLRTISPWLVLATAAIGYLSIPLRTVQWRWLLGNAPKAGFINVFKAICLGYLGNCVLPMRGGELVKTYVLSRNSDLPIARVLASVVLARLQDLLPILVLLAVMFTVIPLEEGINLREQALFDQPVFISKARLNQAFRLFAFCAAGAGIGLIVFYRWQDALHKRMVRVLASFSPRFAKLLDSLFSQVAAGVRVVGDARWFWGAQSLSFICWFIFAIAPVPLLLAFSLEFKQACLTALAMTGLTTFAHLIPSAPGAVGTFHALCLVALLVCNPHMDRNAAVAFTLIVHLIGTAGPALPGLVFLPQSWGQMWRIKRNGVPRITT